MNFRYQQLPMKVLIIVVLLFPMAGSSVNAKQSREWIKIRPTAERFEVLLPQQPKVKAANVTYGTPYGNRTASGKLYSTSIEGLTYEIWSFETLRAPYFLVNQISTFLDEYADLVWESLLKPDRDALPQDQPELAAMVYKSDLSMGVIPGREYSLKLGKVSGATRFYMDGSRLYVLVIRGNGDNSTAAENFFKGFFATSRTPTPFLPVAADYEAEPYDMVFKSTETATIAKAIANLEPKYTDGARKYWVSGTVELKGVVDRYGRVTNIKVLKRLPHGLTDAAVNVAKETKFTPATKDGMKVSQFIQLEYDFNLN
jgi:TonB family protein